jgi:hypothetical protein
MTPPGTIHATKPIRLPEQTHQAGTPHISLTSQQIKEYLVKIYEHYRTAEHHRYTAIPATPGRLNPDAAAEQTSPPEIKPVTLQLHPNIEKSAGASASPMQIAKGVSQFDVIAQLAQAIDPDLAALAEQAGREAALLSGRIG